MDDEIRAVIYRGAPFAPNPPPETLTWST